MYQIFLSLLTIYCEVLFSKYTPTAVMANKVTDAGGATIDLFEVTPGYPVSTFGREPEDQRNLVLKLKDFQCRDDDIFILAPIKSGM